MVIELMSWLFVVLSIPVAVCFTQCCSMMISGFVLAFSSVPRVEILICLLDDGDSSYCVIGNDQLFACALHFWPVVQMGADNIQGLRSIGSLLDGTFKPGCYVVIGTIRGVNANFGTRGLVNIVCCDAATEPGNHRLTKVAGGDFYCSGCNKRVQTVKRFGMSFALDTPAGVLQLPFLPVYNKAGIRLLGMSPEDYIRERGTEEAGMNQFDHRKVQGFVGRRALLYVWKRAAFATIKTWGCLGVQLLPGAAVERSSSSVMQHAAPGGSQESTPSPPAKRQRCADMDLFM